MPLCVNCGEESSKIVTCNHCGKPTAYKVETEPVDPVEVSRLTGGHGRNDAKPGGVGAPKTHRVTPSGPSGSDSPTDRGGPTSVVHSDPAPPDPTPLGAAPSGQPQVDAVHKSTTTASEAASQVEASPQTSPPPAAAETGPRPEKLQLSEAEGAALAKLPRAMAEQVSDLLDSLCHSDELAGLSRENRVEAYSAETIATAKKKISDAPSDQWDGLYGAIMALWTALGYDGQQAYGKAQKLNDDSKAALTTYNEVAPSEGVEALRQIWLALAACNQEAAADVMKGDDWKKYTDAEVARTQGIESLETAKNAKPITLLLDAVSHGGLSRRAIAEHEHAPEIVEKFRDQPEAAMMGLEYLPGAQHPEVLVQGVEALGPLLTSKFAYKNGTWTITKGNSEQLARTALAMGAQLGGSYFEDLAEYYGQNKHARLDPLNPNEIDNSDPHLPSQSAMQPQKRAAVYTSAISKQAMRPDGSVDFGRAADTINDLKFHPDSLFNPLAGLVSQIEATQQEFADHDLNNVMKKVRAPDQRSVGLVQKTFGESTGGVSDEDARAAVLAAMITPFHQGPVGSCFATAPCRKLRETDPAAVMEDIVSIVNNGTLTKGGDPVPAVSNTPENDNPLLRSWEYTVATMGARQENSAEKRQLENALFGRMRGQEAANSLEGLRPLFADWTTQKEKIKQRIAEAFTFSYDPDAVRTDGSDGSSTKGAFQAIHAPTQTPVASEEQFKGYLKEILRDVLLSTITLGEPPPSEAELPAREAEVEERRQEVSDKIEDIVDSPEFRACLEAAYAKSGENYSPWNLPGGGGSEGSTDLLFGGHGDSTTLIEHAEGAGPIAAEQLLAGVVEKMTSGGDDFVSLGVSGVHQMNALPNHPSLTPLRAGGAQANIDRLLVNPGRDAAEAELAEGRPQHILRRAMEGPMKSLLPDDAMTEIDGSMRPRELKAKLLELMGPKIANKVDADYSEQEGKKLIEARNAAQQRHDAAMDRHRADVAAIRRKDDRAMAKFTREQEKYDALLAEYEAADAGASRGPQPTPPTRPQPSPRPSAPEPPDYGAVAQEAKDALRSDLTKQHERRAAGLVDSLLIDELDLPQFVIADTNWGDARDHTQLVVAPDPADGKPVLWKKGALTGEFTRLADEADSNWVNSKWTFSA